MTERENEREDHLLGHGHLKIMVSETFEIKEMTALDGGSIGLDELNAHNRDIMIITNIQTTGLS